MKIKVGTEVCSPPLLCQGLPPECVQGGAYRGFVTDAGNTQVRPLRGHTGVQTGSP